MSFYSHFATFWQGSYKKKSILKITLCVVVLTIVSACVSHPETSIIDPGNTGKWDIYEVDLTSTNEYLNPYLDVWLNATFTGPNGATVIVDGFWDGEKNWKIRMAPNDVGYWNYITYSNDAQLNGKKGSFESIPSNKKGFVIRDPDHKFAFKRSDGEHVFLMGDTCWNCMSHMNGAFSFSIYKTLIDKRSNQKFNFIRSYTVPFYQEPTNSAHYNEGGRAFEPWDPDRLNPEYFIEADKRIAYANSKGITVHLVIGGDGTQMTDFFGWNNGKMERYIRYLAARYSAYDIAWEGRAEFEEQGSTTPGAVNLANQIGIWLEKYDPYGHIQSMHTTNSNNELGDEYWLDWIMHQSQDWSLITKDRMYNKPILNEEFYYEDSGAGVTHTHHVDADTVRKGAWKVMTSGASGLAYGNTGTYNSRSQPFKRIEYSQSEGANYMTHLYNFWSNTKYWELIPNNKIIQEGIAFVVTSPGNEYIFYLPNGGYIVVDLSDVNGTLNMEWYNPRQGSYQGNSIVHGGISRNFTAPDSNDWVLYLNSISPSDI